jgi:hypothetical protein
MTAYLFRQILFLLSVYHCQFWIRQKILCGEFQKNHKRLHLCSIGLRLKATVCELCTLSLCWVSLPHYPIHHDLIKYTASTKYHNRIRIQLINRKFLFIEIFVHVHHVLILWINSTHTSWHATDVDMVRFYCCFVVWKLICPIQHQRYAVLYVITVFHDTSYHFLSDLLIMI